jgi:hypothetical protein
VAYVEINSPLSNTQDDLPCPVTGWTDQLGAMVTVVFIDGSGIATSQTAMADSNTGNWSVGGVSVTGTYSITASVAGLCSDTVSNVVLSTAPDNSNQGSTSAVTLNPGPKSDAHRPGKDPDDSPDDRRVLQPEQEHRINHRGSVGFQRRESDDLPADHRHPVGRCVDANSLSLPVVHPLRVVVRVHALNANNKVVGKTSKKRT